MANWNSTLTPGLTSNLGSLSARYSGFWPAGACYYLATRIAWVLCFPDSKVSLFFPPHAVLVSILLLVPTRHWWAYTLAAAGSHYFATQQAHWPPLYALQCEAFDAVKNVLTAAGIRMFIKSPFHLISLREAIIFVLIAVIIVPVRDCLLGGRLHRLQSLWNSLLGRMAQPQHLEWSDSDRAGAGHPDWRPPAIHKRVQSRTQAHSGSMLPCRGHSRGRIRRLRSVACGTGHFARAPLCTRSPAHLGGPPLWAWRHERLHAGHHDPGDLGNDAGTRAVPDANPRGKRTGPAVVPPDGGHSTDVARGRHR